MTFWWEWDHQSYSRQGSGFLGNDRMLAPKPPHMFNICAIRSHSFFLCCLLRHFSWRSHGWSFRTWSLSFGSHSLSIADSGRVVRALLRAAYRRRRALLDLEGCCALANYFVSRVASCHVSTAWRVLLGLQQLLQKGGGGLEEAHASIMISWRRMLRPWEFLPTDFIFFRTS